MISETQMEALPKSRHEAQLVDRLQESLVAAESQSKKNCQSNLFVLWVSKSGSADPDPGPGQTFESKKVEFLQEKYTVLIF